MADHLRAPAQLRLNTPGPHSQLLEVGLGLVSHTVEIHSPLPATHIPLARSQKSKLREVSSGPEPSFVTSFVFQSGLLYLKNNNCTE